MSDSQGTPQGAPDPDVADLAAKHNISIEEATRLIAERGNDRGTVDAAAEAEKRDHAG